MQAGGRTGGAFRGRSGGRSPPRGRRNVTSHGVDQSRAQVFRPTKFGTCEIASAVRSLSRAGPGMGLSS
eukprot:13340957-Alexandrium_andersonii.AAC.1